MIKTEIERGRNIMNAESGQQSRGKERRVKKRRVKKRRGEERRGEIMQSTEGEGRVKPRSLYGMMMIGVIVTTMLISDFASTSLISYTVVTDETHRHTDTKTE